MYYDAKKDISYDHNHAVYRCSCNARIASCKCKGDKTKEIIRFDNCWCNGKTRADNLNVIRPGKLSAKTRKQYPLVRN